MLEVRVGGAVFHGDRNRGRGFILAPDGFSGWDEGTSIRREEGARPNAHGSFDGRGFQSARVVTLSGNIVAGSGAELRHMKDQLTGLLSDGGMARLSVQIDGELTWSDVRLAGQTSVTVRGMARYTAEFQVQFWAPDPRRYGDLRRFDAGEPVFHRGNAPAFPRVRVQSGSANYDVTSSLGTFSVRGATSGGVHEIDMRTGRLTRNNSPVLGAVTRAQTWAIPAGERVVHNVSAGSGATFEVYDTFF